MPRKKTTKKAPRKATENSTNGKSRARCATPKCRRKATDSGLCTKCHEAAFPIDAVQKVTEIEALAFNSLDVELRNHAQGLQILDLQQTQDANNFQARQNAREAKRAELKAAIEAKKAEYKALVESIAKKYGMDPNKRQIFYCQSGVRTTTHIFALYLMGWDMDRLHNYDGSWIEWSFHEKNPVDTDS